MSERKPKIKQRETETIVEWVVEMKSHFDPNAWFVSHSKVTGDEAMKEADAANAKGNEARAVKITTTTIREVVG